MARMTEYRMRIDMGPGTRLALGVSTLLGWALDASKALVLLAVAWAIVELTRWHTGG